MHARANFKWNGNQHWGRAAGMSRDEHLRSINKIAPGFPIAEYFSSNGHSAADALVRGIKLCLGNKQRKRLEMRLIFRLGTCQPRGLNADFQFIWSSRARAQRNFQILNQLLVSVALNVNEHSTDKGHSPETSEHLLRFWHFPQHSQLLFPYPTIGLSVIVIDHRVEG